MKKVKWRKFEEARDFVHKLNLKSSTEWSKWVKSADRPKDIPLEPSKVYKNEGWLNWFDWLGKTKITLRDFEEARSFVHKLNLRLNRDSRELSEKGLQQGTQQGFAPLFGIVDNSKKPKYKGNFS